MFAHSSELKRVGAAIGRRLVGLVPFAAVLATPALSQAQVIAGNTGVIQVLSDGEIINPTTVAVRDGVAFVAEGQLGRVGVLGGAFQVVTVDLNGAGVLNDIIRLPGNDFFPEGITLDPVTNDLFIGSIFNGTVVKVPGGSLTAEVFAGPAPDVLTRGAFGSKVDNVNNLLWVCDSNLGADPALPGGTLTGLSLADASVVVTHAFPGANDICNDITLDAAGNIFVTETGTGLVFTIDAANALVQDSLELLIESPGIAANGGFGANGLALTGGALFVNNTTAGTLVRFDLAAADIAASEQIVVLTEGDVANTLLSGPDGMLALSDTEILVVENGLFGAGLNRLIKVTLDPLQ
jgi:sugar lactone lactonase YvrE